MRVYPSPRDSASKIVRWLFLSNGAALFIVHHDERSIMLVMLDVTKQAHKILCRKMFESLRVAKGAPDKLLLPLLKSYESFINGAFEHQAIDVRFRLLPDAKDTAKGCNSR